MDYEFTKTDVSLELLTQEIQEQFPDAGCSLGDVLTVHMPSSLTSTEQQTLNDIVDSHVNIQPSVVKIYSHAGSNEKSIYDIHQPPKGLNYRSGLINKLYPKRTVVKGEVTKVDYYRDSGLTDHVLEVTVAYNRDSLGFAIDRTVTRKWVLEDGTFHPDFKVTYKSYTDNPEDQIKEGVRRRRNIIDFLQPRVLSFMFDTMTGTEEEIVMAARDFLVLHKESLERFVKSSAEINDDTDPNYGKKEIVVDIEEDTVTTWLDNTPTALGGATIRQYIIGELSI